jgi:hypothetical protein
MLGMFLPNFKDLLRIFIATVFVADLAELVRGITSDYYYEIAAGFLHRK